MKGYARRYAFCSVLLNWIYHRCDAGSSDCPYERFHRVMKMIENDIFMHEKEKFAPKTFMNENSMHEIVHGPISNEYFWGK